jgi:hypothetical protein
MFYGTKFMTHHAGAKIQTWGTVDQENNGLIHFLDSELFGGNVGHAAIELTFPKDTKGEQLIEDYCKNSNTNKNKEIPFHTKQLIEPNGVYQEYYIVRFSALPGEDGMFIEGEQNKDNLDERLGVNFNYNPRFKNLIQEQRKIKGELGEKVITLAPFSMSHLESLNESPLHKKVIEAKEEVKRLVDRNNFLKKLEDKLNKNKDKPFSITEKLMLTNWMGEDVVDEKNYKNKAELVWLVENEYNKNNKNISEKQKEIEENFKSIKNKAQKDKKTLSQEFVKIQKNNYVKGKNVSLVNPEIIQLLNNIVEQKSKGFSINASIIEKIEKDEMSQKNLQQLAPNWKEKLTAMIEDKDGCIKDITSIIDLLKQKNMELKEDIEKKQVAISRAEIESDFANYLEDYLTLGTPPNHQVDLKVSHEVDSNNSLAIAPMLEKMQEIFRKGNFNLYSENCSETFSKILQAGCTNSQLKRIASLRVMGEFANPQQVLANANKINIYLNHGTTPKINFLVKLLNFDPISNMAGYNIKRINEILDDDINSNKSIFEILTRLLLLIPIGVLALTQFLVKAPFNPERAFDSANAVLKLAFNNNSIAFKVITAMTVGPVVGILAGPAYLQKGLKSTFSKLSNWYRAKFTTTSDNIDREMLQQQYGAAQVKANDEQLTQTSQKINQNACEINAQQTVTETMIKFLDKLVYDQKNIPFFDHKAITQINKFNHASLEAQQQVAEKLAAWARSLKEKELEKYQRTGLPNNPAEIKNWKPSEILSALSEQSLARIDKIQANELLAATNPKPENTELASVKNRANNRRKDLFFDAPTKIKDDKTPATQAPEVTLKEDEKTQSKPD